LLCLPFAWQAGQFELEGTAPMMTTRSRGLATVALALLGLASGCQPSSAVRQATAAGSRQASGNAPADDSAKSAAKAARPAGSPPAQSQPSSSQSSPPVDEPNSAQNGPTNPGTAGDELGQVDPAELVMPKVLFTDAHAQTNLLGVGDQMPAITLPDLAGKNQELGSLLGKQVTVVLFWSAANPYAVAELGDLEIDLHKRFGPRGLEVVAIAERDSPQVVQQMVSKAGVKFPVLLDAQGQALAQLATKKLPRTYLLDGSGKILWFDIEYSRSTWRDLRRAIQYVLTQG
jgi:peroxiredoxin